LRLSGENTLTIARRYRGPLHSANGGLRGRAARRVRRRPGRGDADRTPERRHRPL